MRLVLLSYEEVKKTVAEELFKIGEERGFGDTFYIKNPILAWRLRQYSSSDRRRWDTTFLSLVKHIMMEDWGFPGEYMSGTGSWIFTISLSKLRGLM